MKLKAIIEPLISRRFLGFCISIWCTWSKPETAPFVSVLFGALIGASMHDNHKEIKLGKKIEQKDDQ